MRVGAVYAFGEAGLARPVIVRELLVEGRMTFAPEARVVHRRFLTFKPIAQCTQGELDRRAVWWPCVQIAGERIDSDEVDPVEVAPGVPAVFHCDPKLLIRPWVEHVERVRAANARAAIFRQEREAHRAVIAEVVALLAAHGVASQLGPSAGGRALVVADPGALLGLLRRVLPAPSTPSTPSTENDCG